MNKTNLFRIVLAILYSTVLNCAFPTAIFSQSAAIGGLTLGAVLSKLGSDLKTAIDQAREAGRSSAMEAGLQVNYATQNFAAVYNNQMNQTVNRLDVTVRGQLGELERMTNELKGGSITAVNDISSRIQLIVNALPFRQHQPQLGSVLPRFVVPSPTLVPTKIEITGNFEFASRQGFEPKLRIHNKEIKASEVGNLKLSFLVPSNAFVDIKPSQKYDRFGITTAELIVPWSESKWLGLKNELHQENYRLLIGKLPEVPGSIVIESISETPTTIQTPIERGDFGQRSDSPGGNVDKTIDYEIKPDLNCQLIPNTVEFMPTSAGGGWSRDLIRNDAGGAVYRVNTYHPTQPWKGAGHIDFRLKAIQQCPSTTKQSAITEWNKAGQSDLRWGEQKTFPLQNVTSFKITFVAFDGNKYEFGTSGDGGKLIRVDVGGQYLQIRATDPRTLQWP